MAIRDAPSDVDTKGSRSRARHPGSKARARAAGRHRRSGVRAFAVGAAPGGRRGAGGRPVRVLLLPPQRPVARACHPLRVASGAASN
ncbi:hypothetical protein BURPS668_A2914 [Burkholderia pseudomallei 668]|nr:hypothetical protein BURPS668_A2914 [Burkholderia pseudomallei 668]